MYLMRRRTMFTGREWINSTALIASDDLILRSEARSVLKEMQIGSTCSGRNGFDKSGSLHQIRGDSP
jgi:hypothetical protein